MEECIICFHELDKYSKAVLSCGHSFHLSCIKGWKNNQNKNTYTKLCPICRDTETEIENIIDGRLPSPEPIKPKTVRSSSNSSEGSLLRRRNQSIPRLELVTIRRSSLDVSRLNETRDPFCCCTIL